MSVDISVIRRRTGAFLLILALAALIQGAYFHLQKLRDAAYLRNEIVAAMDGASDEELLLQALQAAFTIPPHRGPGNQPEYELNHPALKALGPPAASIHKHGGHCGRRSRLLIAILDELNIPARKVHLVNSRWAEFHHTHKYVHAVVEAQVDGRWTIVDPLYNIAFRGTSGELAGLSELGIDNEVFTNGISNADTTYSPYFSEIYTYDEYRKFLWGAFPGGEAAYGLAEEVLGSENAANLHLTGLMEQPLTTIALASYAMALLMLLWGLHLLDFKGTGWTRTFKRQAGSRSGSPIAKADNLQSPATISDSGAPSFAAKAFPSNLSHYHQPGSAV